MKPGSFKPLQFLVFMIAMTCFVEQSKAKFCSNSLISTLVQLIPCKPSLSPFSPMPPSLLCCHALKTLGQPCLCAVLDAPPVSGIDYNVAMLLPQKCALNFHPCNSFFFFNLSTFFLVVFVLKTLQKLDFVLVLDVLMQVFRRWRMVRCLKMMNKTACYVLISCGWIYVL